MCLSGVTVASVRFVGHDPGRICVRQCCRYSAGVRYRNITNGHGRGNGPQLFLRILYINLTTVVTADSCHTSAGGKLHILDNIRLIPFHISLCIRAMCTILTIGKDSVFQADIYGI